jgi:N-succinyldiaminopimelate aminotransferase
VNPHLARLQPYPFEKLRQLLAGVTPSAQHAAIQLAIGEPQHATPEFIRAALTAHLAGLSSYPATQGSLPLREAIAGWIACRHGLTLNPETEILPTNGSREALFAFAQTVVDSRQAEPLVVCPNPFYQIYEGAACLAGATPRFLNTLPENSFAFDLDALSAQEWARTQLLYVCSPANPTGKVLKLADWRALFALADRYGFVIASDECYSEIYADAANPPLGALRAAQELGRGNERIVMFSSLSKRSNVPGMRSGFVAGDAALIRRFLLYRTYHGSAMAPPVQSAAIAAWRDEAHVEENRRLYREKFATLFPMLKAALAVTLPDAGFYFWARVPGEDTEFARNLHRAYNVTVLPGSFLARAANGVNPGAGFVRIALVAGLAECEEAAERIVQFVENHCAGNH